MQASVVDLRYKMKNVLKALERNEPVTILYHGKEKGVIVPIQGQSTRKVSKHPFFGMCVANDRESVEAIMTRLRGGRDHDI